MNLGFLKLVKQGGEGIVWRFELVDCMHSAIARVDNC